MLVGIADARIALQVGRWPAGSRQPRTAGASALDLYAERGYDATVAEIARPRRRHRRAHLLPPLPTARGAVRQRRSAGGITGAVARRPPPPRRLTPSPPLAAMGAVLETAAVRAQARQQVIAPPGRKGASCASSRHALDRALEEALRERGDARNPTRPSPPRAWASRSSASPSTTGPSSGPAPLRCRQDRRRRQPLSSSPAPGASRGQSREETAATPARRRHALAASGTRSPRTMRQADAGDDGSRPRATTAPRSSRSTIIPIAVSHGVTGREELARAAAHVRLLAALEHVAERPTRPRVPERELGGDDQRQRLDDPAGPDVVRVVEHEVAVEAGGGLDPERDRPCPGDQVVGAREDRVVRRSPRRARPSRRRA